MKKDKFDYAEFFSKEHSTPKDKTSFKENLKYFALWILIKIWFFLPFAIIFYLLKTSGCVR